VRKQLSSCGVGLAVLRMLLLYDGVRTGARSCSVRFEHTWRCSDNKLFMLGLISSVLLVLAIPCGRHVSGGPL
jgi:hypothetical protein